MHRVPVHMYFISLCMCVPACVGSFKKGIFTEEKNGHGGISVEPSTEEGKKRPLGVFQYPCQLLVPLFQYVVVIC